MRNTRICTEQKLTALKNNWVEIVNMFVQRKKDGTPDFRVKPKKGSRSIHVHKNGHKKYYGASGALKLERFVK